MLATEREKQRILSLAMTLLKISDPFTVDETGFNRVDTCLFRAMLSKHEFSLGNIEWMRRKLLHYKKQLSLLEANNGGITDNIVALNTVFAESAVFGWAKLADSKLIGVRLSLGKKVQLVFKWQNYQTGKVDHLTIALNKKEGGQLLLDAGFFDNVEGIDEALIEFSVTSLNAKLGFGKVAFASLLKQYGVEQVG